MNILSILQLLGGIGLFLYGMSLMGSSLEKLAGSGLERILEKLTTSKRKGVGSIKGWGLGAAVTAIIQSSAATTIMLIGFVNAGIMKVSQAIPVVMGSNVGSTITAQILRLGDLGSDNLVLQLLKPSSFAPMLVGIGAFTLLFTKNKKAKDIAGILVGMGVLFYGMTTMEEVFMPLRDSAAFRNAFTSFSNPLLGILTGLIITAIIQSSSASVGILQALSATGSITYATAIPIIIGQNLGKCMTIFLGSIGANKKAKRVSLSYLLFNIIGALLFVVVIYGTYYTVGISFWNNTVNRGNIANIHLAFNLVTSIILIPFAQRISNLTGKILGEEEISKTDRELATLDDMLLNTPTIALEQCKNVIISMADAIYDNYKIATGLIYNYDPAKQELLEENESFIDKCESALSAYIVKINSKRLSADDRLVVAEILNSVSDFERMGDHCINIFYVAQDKNAQDIHFSPAGHREVDTIIAAVDNVLKTTFEAFKHDNVGAAVRIEPLAETIDKLKETIKAHHVERLQTGDCGIAGGIALVDLVTSFERISSHCANISLHIVKRVGKDRNFDEMHGHANDSFSEEYKALYHYYESQYISPIVTKDVQIPPAEDKKTVEKKTAEKSKKKNEESKKEKAKAVDNTKKELPKQDKDSSAKRTKSSAENKKISSSKHGKNDTDTKHGKNDTDTKHSKNDTAAKKGKIDNKHKKK
ncbi:MAG: Na/Pi cotransporter family protein [Clostridium sp.]|nr:Na/Pi cotransporter family protein [Clostridium sp.]